MKKRLITLVAAAALATVGMAVPASANQSDCDGSIHPGHCGYLASEMRNTNAAPVNHFHTGGDPLYLPGPGGWGKAVSAAAKGQGLKKAHGG